MYIFVLFELICNLMIIFEELIDKLIKEICCEKKNVTWKKNRLHFGIIPQFY